MTFADYPVEPFNVLIVGGGVAALEAALALRDLGGERIATTMIAPNPDFVYRPMTVREPFGYAVARRYPLEELARDIGVELRVDSFKWLDRERGVVHTEAGEQLPYDALLLALGARMHDRFEHALTIDDARLDELLHGLIQDIEGGYVQPSCVHRPGADGMAAADLRARADDSRARSGHEHRAVDHDRHARGRAAGDLRPGGQRGGPAAARGQRDPDDHLGLLRGPRARLRRDQPGRAPPAR